MVKISVDEATVFDMLSILSLKLKNEKSVFNYIQMVSELMGSIGQTLYAEIANSNEYRNLCSANKEVFDLVDLMNSGTDLSALAVHECNMRRYTAKKDLQQKFFNNSLSERKV